MVTTKKTTKKTTKPVKKTPTSAPAKMIKTAVMSDENYDMESCNTMACATQKGCRCNGWLVSVLLIINTLLLLYVITIGSPKNQIIKGLETFEMMRVGGQENHEIMKQIYQLDAFKMDQQRKIQQTLDAFKNLPSTETAPTNTETAPTTN